MDKIIGFCFLAFAFLCILVCISALCAIPTMLLINAIFPAAGVAAVFGGQVTFLQAWGLNILCGILFKSSGVSTKKE